MPADIDESRLLGEAPQTYVARLARAKAHAVALRLASLLPVLAADTIVAVDDAVLGKPRDRDDALAMLALLSGRWHNVFTAVALHAAGVVSDVLSSTRVCFRPISPEEAEAYWRTGEPLGKAGAYGIQGIGGIFATRIEGSFTGVVGLPVAEVETLLRGAGLNTWAGRST